MCLADEGGIGWDAFILPVYLQFIRDPVSRDKYQYNTSRSLFPPCHNNRVLERSSQTATFEAAGLTNSL